MKKIIALTLSLLMSFSCFSLISFAEETDTVEHLTEVPEGYVGVYTKDDLFAVRENPSGKYILMNDIVFEDEDYVKGGDFYNSGAGWEPIGTDSTPFKGVFDGNNYTIYNLYINAPDEDYQGLFGYVSSATIENINLYNANIIGKNCIGGIVGAIHSLSTISNCDFFGTVIGCDRVGGICGSVWNSIVYITRCNVAGTISATNYIGGICGSFYSEYSNIDFCIDLCLNSADIIGKTNVGGILGEGDTYLIQRSNNPSYIRKCANSGKVQGEINIGGIIGQAKGDYYASSNYYFSYVIVDSCMNIGDVLGKSYVGGVIGKGYYAQSNYSYSLGKITAETVFGGIFGDSVDCYTVFSYYLDDAVTNPTCTVGTKKSIDQLKRKGTYEQWDFDTVWTMEGREDYIYPELRDVPLVLPEDTSHKHEYTSEITTPATHTAEGIVTYTCKCGDSYTEVIEKNAEHNYIAEITTPATHMAEGVMTFTCECGDTYTETIKKITAHNFEATVTEPTCTEHGFTTLTCECGETYTRDYVSAIGHKHTAVITDPTCTEEGFTTYTCECGDSYVENYVDATGHIDEDGDYICDNGCGYEFEKTEPETPDEPENNEEEKPCDCNCHKGGITAFFFKLINFFAKLFDSSAKTCKCGAKH